MKRFVTLLFTLSLSFAAFAQAPAARQEITLAEDVLSQYVGNYQLQPNVFFMVTMAGGKLISQITGQQQVPIFAESETTFFPQGIDATIVFQKDAAGAVTGLVLNQAGRSFPAPRYAGELPAAPVHTEITLAPDVLARYVGNYTFPQGFTVAITLENGQLSEQLTGQPKFPIFPETETRFFLKIVEATMEFQLDAAGTVTGVVLTQSGQATTGTKQ